MANVIDCDPVQVAFETVSDTLAAPRFRPI
jgi:hypothetical protein